MNCQQNVFEGNVAPVSVFLLYLMFFLIHTNACLSVAFYGCRYFSFIQFCRLSVFVDFAPPLNKSGSDTSACCCNGFC